MPAVIAFISQKGGVGKTTLARALAAVARASEVSGTVRLVFEQQSEHGSQWATISSIAGKMGCTPETLRSWVWRFRGRVPWWRDSLAGDRADCAIDHLVDRARVRQRTVMTCAMVQKTLAAIGGKLDAMAAKLASPKSDVIIMYGDGAFGLNMMEFEACIRQKINIVGVIGIAEARFGG